MSNAVAGHLKDASAKGKKVFLAGPFKGIVDHSTGVIHAFHQRRFEALIDLFERRDFEVHNAHRREGWGARFMEPEECTRIDYEEIASSDLIVAMPGSPASPGTHIELGWASALGKPIILLLEPDAEYAFLVRGLHTVTQVAYVVLEGEVGHLEEVVKAATLMLSPERMTEREQPQRSAP